MPWRSLIATVAAAVAMFMLSGIWNMIVIAGFLEAAIDPEWLRPAPRLSLIFMGYLCLGAAMAFLFPRFAPDISPPRRTIAFAAFVAFIWIAPYSLVLHGVYRFPWEGIIIDPLWALIEQGAGAWIVASIFQRPVVN